MHRLNRKTAQQMLRENHPELAVRSIRTIGEGWNNIAFEVNGALIFRFLKHINSRRKRMDFEKEKKLLPAIQEKVSVQIPAPKYVGKTYMGYRKLMGAQLMHVKNRLRPGDWREFARKIAEFMNDTNRISLKLVRSLGVRDDSATLRKWQRDSRRDYKLSKRTIPRKYQSSIEKFLREPVRSYTYKPLFCHNDLGIEHILADAKNSVCGIIDWGEAAIADPAFDLGRLCRDLGEHVLTDILKYYRAHEDKRTLRERAIVLAKFSIFEEIQYGLEQKKPEYIRKSLKMIPAFFSTE